MNRPRAHLSACILLGAVVLGSCTIRLGSPEATTEPGSFHREDLDAIVLRASDAPAGTGYADALSGFQDLDAFAHDAQERADLVEDGFVIGHLALFGPAGWTGPGSGRLPLDAPFAQGITGLFASAAGADRAYRRFGEDLRTRQFDQVDELPPPPLGETSFALEGTSGGSHLVIYAWREDNLVLAVTASGVLGARDAAALADVVRDRAET